VLEALKFSAYALNLKVKLTYLNSKDFESGKVKLSELKKYDGVLVPGGFGATGVEGIISAIGYARKSKIPYFGLCYGMQLAVIEFGRNVAGLRNCNTREIDPKCQHLVIDVMDDQKDKLEKSNYGGTMRLGTYPCNLGEGTIARKAYGVEKIYERHRHRYEVNPDFIPKLTKAGMVFSGISPDRRLMEIAELPTKVHPFFLGTQFHPEFQARPLSPHPLFTAFLKAVKARKR
jgi:CTP synthase